MVWLPPESDVILIMQYISTNKEEDNIHPLKWRMNKTQLKKSSFFLGLRPSLHQEADLIPPSFEGFQSIINCKNEIATWDSIHLERWELTN